ncbi:MAG TPA: hypothetical protein VGF55_06055 [Gemmataceae bacterium]|jgi:hypothetical protein
MTPTARWGSAATLRAAAPLLIALLVAAPAAGQTPNSWKATSAANVNWSTAGNWTAGVIANGQIAVFSNAVASIDTSTNDLTNLNLAGITVNGNNAAASPLTIGGNALTVSASGINMSAAATDLTVNTSSLTVGAAQTWTVASGRTLAISTLLLGSQNLTVAGTGTVRLNNLGTAGTVTANGGTLVIGSGAFFIPVGAVTMNATSTLAGVGTVTPDTGTVAGNRVTIASGATVAPGLGGVGTLTVGTNFFHGTAELDGGAKLAVELGSAVPRPAAGIADVNTNDRLNVTGILQFATGTSNLAVAVSGAGQTFTAGQKYDYVIATGSDGLSGFNPAQVTVLPTNFGLPGTFTVQAWNTNNLLLTYTPVPEAGDVLGACAAAAGMGWWVRFWRRRWLAECGVSADPGAARRTGGAVGATPRLRSGTTGPGNHEKLPTEFAFPPA